MYIIRIHQNYLFLMILNIKYKLKVAIDKEDLKILFSNLKRVSRN